MTSAEYALHFLLREYPALRKQRVRKDIGRFVYYEELKRLKAWQVDEKTAKAEASDKEKAVQRMIRDLSRSFDKAARSATKPCGRILVGQGTDTWDPNCVLPSGHAGPCQPEKKGQRLD